MLVAPLCRPPLTHEPRYVTMIKGVEPIGISIVKSSDNSGIFVSRVAEHSLAAKARLEYGDQLLEVSSYLLLRHTIKKQRSFFLCSSVVFHCFLLILLDSHRLAHLFPFLLELGGCILQKTKLVTNSFTVGVWRQNYVSTGHARLKDKLCPDVVFVL